MDDWLRRSWSSANSEAWRWTRARWNGANDGRVWRTPTGRNGWPFRSRFIRTPPPTLVTRSERGRRSLSFVFIFRSTPPSAASRRARARLRRNGLHFAAAAAAHLFYDLAGWSFRSHRAGVRVMKIQGNAHRHQQRVGRWNSKSGAGRYWNECDCFLFRFKTTTTLSTSAAARLRGRNVDKETEKRKAASRTHSALCRSLAVGCGFDSMIVVVVAVVVIVEDFLHSRMTQRFSTACLCTPVLNCQVFLFTRALYFFSRLKR